MAPKIDTKPLTVVRDSDDGPESPRPTGPKVVSTPVAKPAGDKEEPASGGKPVSAPIQEPAGDVDEPEPEPDEGETEEPAEETEPVDEKEKEPTAAEKAAALAKEAEIDKAKDLVSLAFDVESKYMLTIPGRQRPR